MASEPSVQRLRTAFHYFNHFMLGLWRLELGGWVNVWPGVVGRIMVLVHVGRRTGLRRRTPLNYATKGDRVFCIAGFGAISDWYRNVQQSPEVEVWLPDGWWAGVASDVSESESRLRLLREVLIASGFASHLAGIRPRSISDADLDEATKDYRVLEIRRIRALTGPEGPGDLAWIWPAATFVLLAAFVIG